MQASSLFSDSLAALYSFKSHRQLQPRNTFYYLSLHYISVFLSTVVIYTMRSRNFGRTLAQYQSPVAFDTGFWCYDITTIQARSQNIPLFHRSQIFQEL